LPAEPFDALAVLFDLEGFTIPAAPIIGLQAKSQAPAPNAVTYAVPGGTARLGDMQLAPVYYQFR